ncbi:hypothetical protein GF326_04650 [Candidatus Bathyarchaeota archaeon]|nr:hypothetical protein [Candidatus Bathyarchaeota archaeon]
MSETVKKLSFEDMDFKFKAAYAQYTEKFESAHTDERRNELNEVITQLYSEDISYPDYYSIIDKETDDRYRFHRSKINTTRKYAYRKKQQKKNRIDRHK